MAGCSTRVVQRLKNFNRRNCGVRVNDARVLVADKQSWRRSPSESRWMTPARYAGAWPYNDWCTRHASLYVTRCSWRSTGVMWSRRLAPLMRPAAAAFCTDWTSPHETVRHTTWHKGNNKCVMWHDIYCNGPSAQSLGDRTSACFYSPLSKMGDSACQAHSVRPKLHYADTGYGPHAPTDKNLPHPNILTCRDVGLALRCDKFIVELLWACPLVVSVGGVVQHVRIAGVRVVEFEP